MKLLFIVLDGMADRPIKSLNDQTPLEAAHTHALDEMARHGRTGLIEVIKNTAPESDEAVLSLLGYDPHKYYCGRGPFEAIGAGVNFEDGDLVMRANFATTSNGSALIDRRAGRTLTIQEAKQLEKEINSIEFDTPFEFKATAGHRGVLIFKKKLSAKITNTDPAYVIKNGLPHAMKTFEKRVQKSVPIEETELAHETANIVNEFTRKVYDKLKNSPINKKRQQKKQLPANILLLRDAGNKYPRLFSIQEKYNKRFYIIADMPLEKGIAKAADINIVELPEGQHTAESYKQRVDKVIETLPHADAIYVHIKGPDIFGHDGDAQGKKQSIEDIDKYFIYPLMRVINNENILVAVTADHATPCELKAHSSDPVPLLVFKSPQDKGEAHAFSEKECRQGSLFFEGPELMSWLMKQI